MTTDAAADAEGLFRQAVQLHQQWRLDDARTLYQRTLQIQPDHFHALHLSGVLALQNNQAALAADLIGRALRIDPSSVAAHVNHGTAQHELGRFALAIDSYDKAIELKPDCAEAFHNRGNALRQLQRPADAVASFDRAVFLKPDYADAYLNRGLTLAELKRPEAAIESYERAIAAQPNHPEAHYNRGNELQALARYEAAVASYERATALQPGFADAHLNRGSALVALRRYAAALASYETAIALRPQHAESHFNRGGVLQYLGRFDAAVSSYDATLALLPDHGRAHAGRGRALRELKRYEAAIASYDKAVGVDARSAALLATRRHVKMQIADWQGLDLDLAAIDEAMALRSAAPNPFYILTLTDSAARQQRAAQSWVREESPANTSLGPIPKRGPAERIHIGYFSADFHEHATAYLMAELLELHDRSRFRISAFSFGPDSRGPMRKRLAAACDEFTDVRDQSDTDVATLARQRKIDIAIDLKGFTQDHRMGIFSRRAAPLQVNYLGYPGTLGAPYMDYLIADPVLIPPASRPHYTEHIIYLPDSYQVNDSRRPIAPTAFTRRELGLPPTGFVFCCFNNTYKILPATFHRWMRLLHRVEGSVLWLLADNPSAVRNLRREAMARNIAPERLIFAERVDLPVHLARHRAADLCLDTLPCNAHTTASDALWAGLPILTCAGESFAARVAASLLTAIGLPELVASAPDRYEELAVEIATQPLRLAEIRQRLSDNRLTAPLFDGPRYCRYLEAAFSMIWQRYQSDLPPDVIHVPPDGRR
jgi:protein O-GlcNAc transferase